MPLPEAIAIAMTAGGLIALETLLASLDAQLPQAILVCCHTGSSDVLLMCELLARHSALPVIEAAERAPVRPGFVQVAPSGYHLLVEESRYFALSVDPREHYSRPSIDVLDPDEAEVPIMPQAALDLAGADRCLDLAGIASLLNRMCLP